MRLALEIFFSEENKRFGGAQSNAFFLEKAPDAEISALCSSRTSSKVCPTHRVACGCDGIHGMLNETKISRFSKGKTASNNIFATS
jgi:hypothetical protein